MKRRKIITVLIITILMLICAIYNLINRVNVNNQKQIIKEMAENEQITNLEMQINNLQLSHTQYSNYIETSKAAIAKTLTEEGIETKNSDTFETMINNISNIFKQRTLDATATADDIVKGKTAYVNGNKIIGTLDINKTPSYKKIKIGEDSSDRAVNFDCTSIPNYQNLTIDNFSIEPRAIHYSTSNQEGESENSYNPETGILTIGKYVRYTTSYFDILYTVYCIYID